MSVRKERHISVDTVRRRVMNDPPHRCMLTLLLFFTFNPPPPPVPVCVTTSSGGPHPSPWRYALLVFSREKSEGRIITLSNCDRVISSTAVPGFDVLAHSYHSLTFLQEHRLLPSVATTDISHVWNTNVSDVLTASIISDDDSKHI